MADMIKKEPLIRIAKRAERSNKQKLIIRLLSVLLAICAGGIFILILGKNPISYYAKMVKGAFIGKNAANPFMPFKETIKIMIPLLISSLGITLAFKMKFWNIGAEGQIIMGGIFASYFALYHYDMPHYLLFIVMFIAAMIDWLTKGAWQDPESKGYPKIARFDLNAWLDSLGGVQIGWVIGLVLVIFVFIYLKYTKQGYEITVVSDSHATARYAGMSPSKIMIRTMFLSGAICGIAGMVQACGTEHTLSTSVAGGVGFTAIIVAWLANLNPFGILVVSFLFAVLEKGSTVVSSEFVLSPYCSDVLQGIILFFVLGCEFFIRYRFITRGGRKND